MVAEPSHCGLNMLYGLELLHESNHHDLFYSHASNNPWFIIGETIPSPTCWKCHHTFFLKKERKKDRFSPAKEHSLMTLTTTSVRSLNTRLSSISHYLLLVPYQEKTQRYKPLKWFFLKFTQGDAIDLLKDTCHQSSCLQINDFCNLFLTSSIVSRFLTF